MRLSVAHCRHSLTSDANHLLCFLQSFGWLLAVLQISLGPGLPDGIALPQLICYDELEGMDSIMWLGMDNAIIVNDRSEPQHSNFACFA